MRSWLLMLGGLVAWAVQFFALYILASVFPGANVARIAAIVVTVGALAADVVLLGAALRRIGQVGADAFDRWVASTGMLVAGLSLVAVVWQGLPAILI